MIGIIAANFALGCGAADSSSPGAGTYERKSMPAIFEFSDGVRPIEYDLEGEIAHLKGKRPEVTGDQTQTPTSRDEALSDSKSCRRCHKTVYDNWYSSRHRVSFTNRLYKESHAREASVWCVNCHAPLLKPGGRPLNEEDRVLADEGISCLVCHVRKGKILTGTLPPPAEGKTHREHEYRVFPEMKSADFCASCHQFNFPSIVAPDRDTPRGLEPIIFSDLVMQDTFMEWKSSTFGGGGQPGNSGNITSCQNCHLLSGSPESHLFPGGHNLKRLAKVLSIEAKYVEKNSLLVTVYSMGIGHAFPTGDLFRTLRVRLKDSRGRLQHTLVLQKYYESVPKKDRKIGGAPRVLAKDTVIQPPRAGDYVSGKSFVIPWPAGEKSVRFEMHMDYLHAINHLLTKMPLSQTRPLFKKGRVKIEGI